VLTHPGDQIEPSMQGVFRLVLVGLRIPEIDEKPVAHKPRNVAPIVSDYFSADGLKPTDDSAQILWIKLNCECRRAHQVAKQHCQIAFFGLGRRQ
jgi:hypothetical protein